jgi:hypothetical protein
MNIYLQIITILRKGGRITSANFSVYMALMLGRINSYSSVTKRFKLLGIKDFLAELIQAGGNTLISEIHKFVNSV